MIIKECERMKEKLMMIITDQIEELTKRKPTPEEVALLHEIIELYKLVD